MSAKALGLSARADGRAPVGAADEDTVAGGNHALRRFTCGGINEEGIVVDALADLELSDRFGGVRRLVDVCRHPLIYAQIRQTLGVSADAPALGDFPYISRAARR